MPPSLLRSVARLPVGKLVFELFLGFVTVLAALRIGRGFEVQRRLEAVLDQRIASFAPPMCFDTERASATATASVVTFATIVELELIQTAACEHCLAALGSG